MTLEGSKLASSNIENCYNAIVRSKKESVMLVIISTQKNKLLFYYYAEEEYDSRDAGDVSLKSDKMLFPLLVYTKIEEQQGGIASYTQYIVTRLVIKYSYVLR